ncbi:hypothetical protein [Pseudooceanicola aestuarii]|uniref:hypothetical protein n=1 Tax=Pseudooceanicola aestuarii TaxID=2697319 RepID=UPI0013D0EDE0|nr:hypothetical protein [Pseudooceanicola aestuarii]
MLRKLGLGGIALLLSVPVVSELALGGWQPFDRATALVSARPLTAKLTRDFAALTPERPRLPPGWHDRAL